MSIVIVTSQGLNLREIPGNWGHVVDQLNHNDELAVIDHREAGSGRPEWLRVRVARTNETGWVDSTYTTPKLRAQPKPPQVSMPRPVRPPYRHPFEEPIKPLPKYGWPKSFWVLAIGVILAVCFWLLRGGY